MRIIGLTGSIGMGKTTTAYDFYRLGAPVHHADEIAHKLMGAGGAAVRAVASAFPGVLEGGEISRIKLGCAVFADPVRLRKLEEILHPMIAGDRINFLAEASRRRVPMVVLDVPLLFETRGDRGCDAVVTVSAPAFVQAQRVLARPGMDRKRLDQILAQQIPDPEKCRRSDFVVPTGLGRLESLRKVRKIIADVSGWPATRWPPWAAGRRIRKKNFCAWRS